MSKKVILKILFVVVVTALAYTGCTSHEDSLQTSQEGSQVYSNNNPKTTYCLGCHGGSYTIFAESTSHLGENDWTNPHRSAHGTGFGCETCHEMDATASQNTKCYDKQVMTSSVCSTLCHKEQTAENPYYYPYDLTKFKPQTYLE